MKIGVVNSGFLLALAAVMAGCASAPERPEYLSDIPDYSEPEVAFNTDARVCVYKTMWYSNLLADAIKESGYTLVASPEIDGKTWNRVDFVIEPLYVKHTTQLYHKETWLFTYIAVQVRTPLRVASPSDSPASGTVPRIFQAYARTNIGKVDGRNKESCHYTSNVKSAIANLMKVQEFRKALEK